MVAEAREMGRYRPPPCELGGHSVAKFALPAAGSALQTFQQASPVFRRHGGGVT
jgi:hypothetical protein